MSGCSWLGEGVLRVQWRKSCTLACCPSSLAQY